LLQYLDYLRGAPSKIPSVIKDNPETLGRSYVAGFTDADGWIGDRIKFSQKASDKLQDIKFILNELQINTGQINKERDIHALYIAEKRSKMLFFDIIPLLHPKHQRMVDQVKSM
jgi:hypothetical protein